MVRKRQIHGGKELIDFFCKDADEGNKEYCKFIIDYENKGIYTGTYTSYEDGDSLYNDLLNPNIKWDVTFNYSIGSCCEILLFENTENWIEIDVIDYNGVKNFFKANK